MAARNQVHNLVWLDENVFSRRSNKNLLENLEKLFPECLPMTDESEAVRFITRLSISSTPCILIISRKLAESILSQVHDINCLMKVFIYCDDKQRAQHLAQDRCKVVLNPTESH